MKKALFPWIMVAVLALSACAPQLPVETPTSTPVMAVFEVFANTPWQDTGLQVNAGNLVAIQYSSGSWTTVNAYHPLVDGDGNVGLDDPKNPYHPVPGAFPGVLIAKIGEGIPREIGNQKEFRSCDTGALFLQMNDDVLSDNEGSIVVQISVSALAENVACDPVETPVPISDLPTPAPAILTFTSSPRLESAPTSTPDLSTMGVRLLDSTSPDGQWRAEALLAFFIGDSPIDYARLTVSRVDGAIYWTPYEEWSESGLGDSLLSDFHWSADGHYLYFTHIGVSEPCGYPFTTNLRRVDLEDGSLSDIPLTDLDFVDILTISPGARRMAYRTAEGILVYDLENSSSHTFPYVWPPPDSDLVVGGFVWSPDGEELAFSITESQCFTSEPARISIQVLDLDSGKTRTPESQDFWLYAPEKVPTDLVATATLVLQDYLNSLYWGSLGGLDDYTLERAARLYGGSYETLIELNPGINPNDNVALLHNACQVNGFQCLRLREVISSQVVQGENGGKVVLLTVRLMKPDGSVFVRGSCCSEDAGLPQTKFDFSIRQLEDGTFTVLDLPPYLP